ncbi:hypothetical protein A2642_02470 [Candidatus Nomurabacteria bacterium RIFCSPHIGHO2_01_FULL_39_10]|uniref:Uncharacterized protein n=1 Tax=Candidatus Nomurabacteria bacterium RIFCSPHIGHO2_01_FULL_39_10 TaxID=1801733 RepID=A0A1F6VAS5_9BACT|nr:MAG: hypothetical protein A2642_02470 [Candidatus Nomurabacteria bacterium RIFCSPHIGHO2_01_FULL_39_10]
MRKRVQKKQSNPKMKLFNQKTLESLQKAGKTLKFVANPHQGILVTITKSDDGEDFYGQGPGGGDHFLEEMERAFEEALDASNQKKRSKNERKKTK